MVSAETGFCFHVAATTPHPPSQPFPAKLLDYILDILSDTSDTLEQLPRFQTMDPAYPEAPLHPGQVLHPGRPVLMEEHVSIT